MSWDRRPRSVFLGSVLRAGFLVHYHFQDVSEPDHLVRVASGKGCLHARLLFTRKVFLKVWMCERYGDGSFDSKRNVLQGRQMCGALRNARHAISNLCGFTERQIKFQRFFSVLVFQVQNPLQCLWWHSLA